MSHDGVDVAHQSLRVSEDDSLYRTYIPQAIRLAFLLTGDSALALDLAHEAFLRTAPRSASLRSPERFGAYLCRAVVRTEQMRRRSRAREEARIERTTRGLHQVDQIDQATDRLDLVSLLQRLPTRQRSAIVLRYWADLSEADIARALRCRPGTVKSSLARGLATLREQVQPHD